MSTPDIGRHVCVQVGPYKTYQGILADRTETTITLTDWEAYKVSDHLEHCSWGTGPTLLAIDATTSIVEEPEAGTL